jgi:hypothetical protein
MSGEGEVREHLGILSLVPQHRLKELRAEVAKARKQDKSQDSSEITIGMIA